MAAVEAGPHGVAFVSHDTDNDGTVAMAICGALELRGLRCWIASRDIPPGVPWPQAIVNGINASRLLILVLSTAANESKWVLREVMAADKRGLPIVPVRIEAVEPAETLEFIVGPAQWFDAYPPPVEQHIEKLEQSVRSLATVRDTD
jgi:TIR domain